MSINETHDPNLKSWVESANDPETDFPIQNLPFVAFHRDKNDHGFYADTSIGVAIGDRILDLGRVCFAPGFESDPKVPRGFEAFFGIGVLDALACEPGMMHHARCFASRLLTGTDPRLRDDQSLQSRVLLSTTEVEFKRSFTFKNYTDFYASIHHATTVGSMFRPDNPLLPNYKHIPIGYHGRASSIIPSGTPIVRPRGQQAPPDDNPTAGPTFGPCTMLDYELEVGAIIGRSNGLGTPVNIDSAEDHIFGLCLVNDWSARDIQKWEYQPLGPFLAKSFATTISPYVVTMEALAPFRCPAYKRPDGDPRPLPYLFSERDQAHGGFDITLEVQLRTAEMEKRGMSPVTISRSNAFKDMYWTLAQMVTHHTSNGCNLQTGDLLASGTVSGTQPGTRGCLLESTWQGRGADGKPLPRKPIELPTGEKRIFLQDGDEVILKGWCERDGFRRIGFGDCRGKILPPP